MKNEINYLQLQKDIVDRVSIKKALIKSANQSTIESIISDIAFDLSQIYEKDFDFDVHRDIYESAMDLIKSKEFWV